MVVLRQVQILTSKTSSAVWWVPKLKTSLNSSRERSPSSPAADVNCSTWRRGDGDRGALERVERSSAQCIKMHRDHGERPRVLKRTSSMVPCTKEVCFALFARPELPSATATIALALFLYVSQSSVIGVNFSMVFGNCVIRVTAAHANMADEGEEVVEDTEWEVPDEQLTAEEVFIKYDTDHSGAIDMDEFKVRVRHTVLEQSRSGWYW